MAQYLTIIRGYFNPHPEIAVAWSKERDPVRGEEDQWGASVVSGIWRSSCC